MSNEQKYTEEMAKLWFSKLTAGEQVGKIEDWILIETAKLVEAGQMSDKTGREITKHVMAKGFRSRILKHINDTLTQMEAA